MDVITFGLDLPLKICLYVLLPIFVILLILRLILGVNLKKIKKVDINQYHYIMNYWSCFAAILITTILLVITIFYARYFDITVRNTSFMDQYKILYYIVMALPIIPTLFLIYYFINLFSIKKEKINSDSIDLDYEDDEFEFETDNIKENSEDLNISENKNEKAILSSKNDDIEIL